MDSTPDAVLRHAFDYVPSKAFLPVANVSKRFRFVWLADDASALSSGGKIPADDDERKMPARTNDETDDERKMPADTAVVSNAGPMEEDSEQPTTTSAAELRGTKYSGHKIQQGGTKYS